MRKVLCVCCGVEILTTAPNVKRCEECRAKHQVAYQKQYRKEHYVRKGYSGWGENNNNWKNGLGKLINGWNRAIKAERRYCEICRNDLQDVGRYHWVIHHRDRDRTNNRIENLQLLCKRCHQILHECHKAFEGAETISSESTS